MRTLQLSSPTVEGDWAGKFASEEHFDLLINESAKVLRPDGSVLCIVLKKGLSPEVMRRAWAELRGYNPKTNNRGIAAGTGYIKKKKMDGTVSKTNRTPKDGEVVSGIIGFFERTVRFPYCRPSAYTLENPEGFANILPLFQEASQTYERVLPEKYAYQKGFIDKSSPDFVIPGTIFSTITINKNFRTAYHKDAGDLSGGYSCMALLREGKYEGGDLVFPAYRAAVRLDTGDLIFFDPHEFHGNTGIIPLTDNYQRCTLVMYYREGIQFCGTSEEELERAKHRKAGDKLK